MILTFRTFGYTLQWTYLALDRMNFLEIFSAYSSNYDTIFLQVWSCGNASFWRFECIIEKLVNKKLRLVGFLKSQHGLKRTNNVVEKF
jgi:hypothetical protein